MKLDFVRDKWDELPSATRQKVKKVSTGAGIIFICLVAYWIKDDKKPEVRKVETKRELGIGKDMLADDIRSTVNKAVDNWKDSDSDKEKRLQALELIASKLSDGPTPPPKDAEDAEQTLDETARAPKDKPQYPQPPSYPGNGAPGMAGGGAGGINTGSVPPAEPPKPLYIGGIGHVSGSKNSKGDDSKKKNSVYLPPSFMDGMVLTGIEADASQNAKDDPEPIMIRVEAPAQLPNELKADLKGCFVVANAVGKLNKERVDPRLVSLHCMLTNGDAVIDQPIKGMVVDEDGKKGLAGIVVSKSGTLVARSVLAGVAGGLGESVAISNTTTQISPIGVQQTLDTDKALQSGIGHGLKAGTSEIQKIYLDLIKQTTPVIEIGAAKKCTVVITEGVQLEIKNARVNG